MGRNISILVKQENTMDDDSAALGIVNLTYRPYVPGNDPWKSATGTRSGFGKFTGGEWAFSLEDAGAGNSYHYYIYNSNKKIMLSLLSVTHPRDVSDGETGIGTLHLSGGGTLSAGAIEWKILGAY